MPKHIFRDDFPINNESAVNILCDGYLVGVLSATREGLEFSYGEEWTRNGDPLSPLLPFGKRHKSEDVHAYFDSFLPEGKRRDILMSQDKLPAHDLVGFLRRHGEDLPGMLYAEPLGKSNDSEDITGRVAGLIASGGSLADIRQHSLLSGVDDKIAVIAEKTGDEWHFRVSNIENPSTHIIKKGNSLCVNEFFSSTLAGLCGVNVMPSDILSYNGEEAFITRRFDRKTLPDGKITRIEQKDFCQLAGKKPDEKYFRLYHGFSNDDLAKILSSLSRKETWSFLSGAMFSLVIGNSDDHGKNYAILYDGEPKISPFYDLASISGYLLFDENATGTTRLARPIGKALYDADLTPADMRAHAKLLGVNFSEFAAFFSKIVNSVRKNANEAHRIVSGRLNELGLSKKTGEADFLREHMLGRCDEFYLSFAGKLKTEAAKMRRLEKP